LFLQRSPPWRGARGRITPRGFTLGKCHTKYAIDPVRLLGNINCVNAQGDPDLQRFPDVRSVRLQADLGDLGEKFG